jgi:hypothetical protein
MAIDGGPSDAHENERGSYHAMQEDLADPQKQKRNIEKHKTSSEQNESKERQNRGKTKGDEEEERAKEGKEEQERLLQERPVVTARRNRKSKQLVKSQINEL